MKPDDKHIREIFSERLQNLESDVPSHIWSSIEAHLTVPSAGVSGTSSGALGKAGLLKWVAGITAGIAAAGSVIYLVTASAPDNSPVHSTPVPASHSIQKNQSSDKTPSGSQTAEQETTERISTDTHPKTDSEKPAPLSSSASRPYTSEPTTVEDPTAHSDVTTPPGISGADVKGNPSDVKTSPLNSSDNPHPSRTSSPAQSDADEIPTAAFSVKPIDEFAMNWFFIPQFDKATSYQWNFGDGDTSNSLSAAHTYTEEGEYTVSLSITGVTGDKRTQSQQLVVRRPGRLNPVNAFSPNGDMKNDGFDILANAINIDRLSEWIVFDASGRKVFESRTDSVWYGIDMSGNTCPPGNYRYVVRAIDTAGMPVEKSGSVRLFAQ